MYRPISILEYYIKARILKFLKDELKRRGGGNEVKILDILHVK